MSKLRKIVFIDIDGVLNTNAFISAFWEFCRIQNIARPEAKKDFNEMLNDEFGNLFCPTALRAFRYIHEQTNCDFVMSSTWRMSGLKRMQLMWEKRDLPGNLIDATPILNTKRGEEIAEYLRNNSCDSYCIIDDDCDMLPEQSEQFVRTNNTYGLTMSDAECAISILNKI